MTTTVASASLSRLAADGSRGIGISGLGERFGLCERRIVPGQERFDVAGQQPRRFIRVAGGGRAENRLVLGGFASPGRRVLPGRRGYQRGLITQVIQYADEHGVAAAEVEGAVEVTVGQAAFGPVGGLVRPLQRTAGRVGLTAAGHGAADVLRL